MKDKILSALKKGVADPKTGKARFIGFDGKAVAKQMISAEDSYYTYEYSEHYKVLPAINGWASSPEHIKDGRKVPEGFVYSSDNNSQWMSDGQLLAWIEANRDRIGSI